MAYINDYNREIDYEVSGQLLSDPSVTHTIYVKAKWHDEEALRVYRGDPVVMDVKFPNPLESSVVRPYVPSDEYAAAANAIVGVALADAVYYDDDNDDNLSRPFPVVVAGDVIATVPASHIQNRAVEVIPSPTEIKGHFYVGEYVAADGTPTTSQEWIIGGKLPLGQIVAPKTDNLPEPDVPIKTRLYERYKNDPIKYYHIPVRLTLAPVIPALYQPAEGDKIIKANAVAKMDTIKANMPCAVFRKWADNAWKWMVDNPKEGALANALALEQIQQGQNDKGVLVYGTVRYVYNDMVNIVANSPRARLSPFGARLLTAYLRNDDEDPTAGYYVGMRVTDDLLPIESLVDGNQYGQITDIDSENGEIYVSLDAVATRAPATKAPAVIETEDINEDTPVGIALIENPITKRLMRCRFATDNVDGVLQEAVQLPEIYGWSLRDYRAMYGNSVFMAPDGGFWSAVKSFAKGVYKRVIKPAAEWAISVVAPAAAQYVGPLGEVLASQVSTKCGQLLEAVTPAQLNGAHSCTSVFGGRSNEDMVEVYTDNSASYSDSHPNDTYVYEIDEPEANGWVIGDCLTVSADSGKAVKIDAYDTPIDAVVNFEPAQDPETNGWKIAGIARGHTEIRSSTLKVGKPVLYDGTDASTRLAAGQATAIIGRVKEVWQPSESVLAAVRAGKRSANDGVPNCIVEVRPEFHPATSSVTEKTSMVMFTGTQVEEDPEPEQPILEREQGKTGDE